VKAVWPVRNLRSDEKGPVFIVHHAVTWNGHGRKIVPSGAGFLSAAIRDRIPPP
jgi:hypothetical protein